jgi:hypothetical protein
MLALIHCAASLPLPALVTLAALPFAVMFSGFLWVFCANSRKVT